MPPYWNILPSRWSSATIARRGVIRYLLRCGVNAQDVQDLEVAAGEALANAAEHGHRNYGFLEVGVYIAAGEVVIEVRDSGPGFDFPVALNALRPASDRGFGITLMRALCDRIDYLDNGTRVRLMKKVRLDAPAELARADEPPGRRIPAYHDRRASR